MKKQQSYLIQSFIRQIEHCEAEHIPIGKVLLQMQADLGYSGTIFDYLESLEVGRLPLDLLGKLSWWKEHLGLLLRTTQEKRRKRRQYLERVSLRNELGFEQKVEAIVFSKNPYDED